MKLLVLAFSAGVLLFVGCKKGDDPETMALLRQASAAMRTPMTIDDHTTLISVDVLPGMIQRLTYEVNDPAALDAAFEIMRPRIVRTSCMKAGLVVTRGTTDLYVWQQNGVELKSLRVTREDCR